MIFHEDEREKRGGSFLTDLALENVCLAMGWVENGDVLVFCTLHRGMEKYRRMDRSEVSKDPSMKTSKSWRQKFRPPKR